MDRMGKACAFTSSLGFCHSSTLVLKFAAVLPLASGRSAGNVLLFVVELEKLYTPTNPSRLGSDSILSKVFLDSTEQTHSALYAGSLIAHRNLFGVGKGFL